MFNAFQSAAHRALIAQVCARNVDDASGACDSFGLVMMDHGRCFGAPRYELCCDIAPEMTTCTDD